MVVHKFEVMRTNPGEVTEGCDDGIDCLAVSLEDES